MERDVAAVLEEILAALEAIREATGRMTFEEFCKARIERLAVERAIEIVSEAARHLPPDLPERHPGIEWKKVKAIGKVLRHEYHRVSDKIVWDVVQLELNALERTVRAELERALRGA
jgi:uncharacterized protein with HEPN domain